MEYLLLISGFVILLYSGNYLVRGSISLAHKYRVSTLVIGVTVVSFGTSAPELFVSVIAAAQGHPAITVGNIIGSNIANIALVLAATSIIIPIPVKTNTIKYDWPVMMITSIIFYIFILYGYLRLWQGIIFIVFLVSYVFLSLFFSKKNYEPATGTKLHMHNTLPFTLLFIFFISIGLLLLSSYPVINLVLVLSLISYSLVSLFFPKKNNVPSTGKKIQVQYSLPVALLVISLSGICLALSSYLLVNNAVSIAKNIGISERVISISVIAFGTSVPELATSMIAAFKKEMDISIGNIIGSNIFNILGVLGIASLITPIPINEMILKVDVLWMLGISFLLLLFILPLKGGKLTRMKGTTLLVIYCVYIYLLFIKPS